ncbi:MAG: hypothetical protein QNJ53_17750 [Pleurocapsa sp. MO_192.B19]|nr:hypothetical protein [Pleurocapsa sp. MO_192.B19]
MNNIRKKTQPPSPSFELKTKSDLVHVKDTNKVVVVFTLLASSIIISSLASLILVFTNHALAQKQRIYVEQPNGLIEAASEQDADYRSNEVIKQTLSNWLYLTWEWDGRISGSEELDRGVNLKNEPNNVKVPSKVYAASYLIEDGFRQEFLKGMSQLVPKSVYQGDLTSNLNIYDISDPVRNKDKYEVQVVATRIDISTSGEEAQTKFNKIFVFETIEPYRLVLGESEPSAFRKQLNQLMKNGLIITEIRNI